MEDLCGKWQQVSEDNYDALLTAVGLSDEKKKVFLSSKAVVEISKDGDTWHFQSTVMGNTRKDSFKLGVETEGMSIIGQKATYKVIQDGNALVETSKVQGKEVTTRRYVENGKMVSKYTIGDVTAYIYCDKA